MNFSRKTGAPDPVAITAPSGTTYTFNGSTAVDITEGGDVAWLRQGHPYVETDGTGGAVNPPLQSFPVEWRQPEGELRANGATLPVVTGGEITADTSLPSSIDAGAVHVTLDAIDGDPTALSVAPGDSFGTVLLLTVPPSSLAPNQVAAVVDADGSPTDLFFGV